MNKILIGIIGFAIWTTSVFFYGIGYGKKSLAAAVNKATIEATAKARTEEQAKQEAVNAIAQKQYEDISIINAALTDDIARLYKRKRRKNLPEDTGTRCEGATGANLSASDAEFLVREAARADKIRVGLKACYTYADKIAKDK